MHETRGNYTKTPVKVRYKSKADGRKSIYFDIYVDGKRTYETLPGLYLIEETTDDAVAKNKATLNKVEKLRQQRIRQIGKTTLPAKYSAKDEQAVVTLFSWLDRYYTIQKNRGVRNIYYIIRTKRMLSLYSPDLDLSSVDKAYCIGFSNFLKTEYRTDKGKLLSSKSGFNYLCEFNTALNTAVREGLIQVNPMSLLSPMDKIQPVESIREYLTIDEVKMLIKTPCQCHVVKQAFLFSCNCGLRLSDILALKWKDLYCNRGVWKVATRIIKTENMVYIPLPKQALRWLPDVERIPDDKVFSHLTRQAITTYLKPWVSDAGIRNKNVTYHTSRHTYATMLLTLGVDLYTVSKLLGHSSIRNTQRYAKIVSQMKDDAVSMLDNKMMQ